MSKFVWEANDITQEVNMREQVKKGTKTFLVRGSVDFEVEVSDVESKAEAVRIVETMEGKISPWAERHSDVTEFELEVEESFEQE